MFQNLAMPKRNIYEFVLCSVGAYIITKLSFPPNKPPPSFPFLYIYDNDHRQEPKE